MMDYMHDLLPVITCINVSLAFGHVSTSMKMALVRLLIKKPSLDKEVFQSYWPVSNLMFLSKVLDRVVSVRLGEDVTVNCLLKPRRSAYRANHSTETVLLRVQSDLLMAVDKGCAALLVLLDLSAAFDTLTTIVCWLACSLGSALAESLWTDQLASYLRDRVQRVNIKEMLSTERELLLGVPQGSMLHGSTSV